MSLSVGIVGLPNAGKSTLFNALLKEQDKLAESANYPFTTIEPNIGVVPVPDERLERILEVVEMSKVTPATVTFKDIAGLVEGAHKGEGLGNQFLGHIRETDLIVHVLRDFEDPDVVVTGSGDPLEDFVTVETELQLKDIQTVEKQVEPKGKLTRKQEVEWRAIVKAKKALEKGQSVREVEFTIEEKEKIDDLFFLTAKPVLVVLNVGEDKLRKRKEVKEKLMVRFRSEGYRFEEKDVLVLAAKLEEDLVSFSEKEKTSYLREVGLRYTGLERLIRRAYKRLGLISFLTPGPAEVRAWPIKKGTKAKEAAGVVHTDFEKGFIKAKVVNWQDFVRYEGWNGVSEEGKIRLEGRDYVVKEGDVVEFVSSS